MKNIKTIRYFPEIPDQVAENKKRSILFFENNTEININENAMAVNAYINNWFKSIILRSGSAYSSTKIAIPDENDSKELIFFKTWS
jgi:hypothetical protein